MRPANVVVHITDPSAEGVARALKIFRRRVERAGLLPLFKHDSKLFVARTKGQRRRFKSALARRRVHRRAMRAEQREAEFLEIGGERAAYHSAVANGRRPAALEGHATRAASPPSSAFAPKEGSVIVA